MKSELFLVAAFAALTVSCARETGTSEPSGKLIDTVVAVHADGDVKTVLGGNGVSVLWSPHDEIGVYYNSTGVKFISANDDPAAQTVFTSSQPVIYADTEMSDGQYLYGIYPYDDGDAQDGDVLTLTVPDMQTAVKGSFARGAFPSVARSKDTRMAFYNVCGGVRFTLWQEGIRKIVFSGNNDEILAGKVKVRFGESGFPELAAVESGAKSVTLTAPDEGGFKTGEWYYISALPVSLDKGFTMTFFKGGDLSERGSKSKESSAEVKRSVFGSLVTADVGVSFEDVSGIYATCAGRTSSTLSFTWTERVSAEDDASRPYKAVLYSDPSCTQEVLSYDIPAGTFSSSTKAGFVFSGLTSGTKYYFKVSDIEKGLTSKPTEAETAAFQVVQMPEGVVRSPGVILAEDFSELRWDCDLYSGCAGYKPEVTSSFSSDKGGGSFSPYSLAEGSYPYRSFDSTFASSRLKDWALDSNGYIRPGMVEIGKPGAKGWLFTPEFRVPCGGSITVDVTVDASTLQNTESGIWCIAVMSRDNANVSGRSSDFDHHPSAGDATKIQHFTLDTPGKFKTLVAKGLVVEDGDRIMFGLKASYKNISGNLPRALIDDFKVEVKSVCNIEDPLEFADGRPVLTESDWRARREEILEIFQSQEYGRMPEASPVYLEKIESGYTVCGDEQAVRSQYRMWYREDRTGPHTDWLIVSPRNADKPSPVIITLNYCGNHQMLYDPEILIPECWLENDSFFKVSNYRAQESGRGLFVNSGKRYHYPVSYFLSRGYSFVTACYGEMSADPEVPSDYPEDFPYDGLFDLWGPRDKSKGDNTTSLAAWAWGLMRGMDMICTMPELDETKVLLTGCSRLGKAAIVAGAFDERFAVVVPVQTGSGGVPLNKHPFTGKETVADDIRNSTHWFCKNFGKYADNESEMPFDQHMLISCVAPRPILVCGFENPWFDTQGEFLALKAAEPVWRFLGKTGVPATTWPAKDQSSISLDMGYYRRGDKNHGVVMAEWTRMLDFADKHFKEE